MEAQALPSTNDHRQQYAVQLLLASGLILAVAASVIMQLGNVIARHPTGATSRWLLLVGLSMACLYGLANRGYHKVSAYLLIAGCLVVGIVALLQWSIDLPNGLLDFALIIMMSGRLIGTRPAAMVAVVVIVVMVVVGLLEAGGLVDPDVSWLSDGIETGDILIFAAIFSVVALVCWLTNRDADRLLHRAQASEAAVRRERDSLELTVRKRTDELQRLQLGRVLELQRLAVIGRQTAGLLHDLANPITAVAITLEQLSSEERSHLVSQAVTSVGHLERYVVAARKQFQKEGVQQLFDPEAEVYQVVSIFEHQARKAGVKLTVTARNVPQLYGDPVRFSQLTLNLVSNAIEAYKETPASVQREVAIEVTRCTAGVLLVVVDQGCGITPTDLPRIFEPFFSNRNSGRCGTGIGLTTVRDVVEQEFGGKIEVLSQPGRGSTFRVELPSPSVADQSLAPRSVASARQS